MYAFIELKVVIFVIREIQKVLIQILNKKLYFNFSFWRMHMQSRYVYFYIDTTKGMFFGVAV